MCVCGAGTAETIGLGCETTEVSINSQLKGQKGLTKERVYNTDGGAEIKCILLYHQRTTFLNDPPK